MGAYVFLTGSPAPFHVDEDPRSVQTLVFAHEPWVNLTLRDEDEQFVDKRLRVRPDAIQAVVGDRAPVQQEA